MRIEYNSKSDEKGRCTFTLFWWVDYIPGHPDGEHGRRERAQVFFGDPTERGYPRLEEAGCAIVHPTPIRKKKPEKRIFIVEE